MKTHLTVAGYPIKDNKTLLVHHVKTRLWLPAGGHIEKNETPDDALKRELKDELGIDIKILNVIPIPKKGNILEQLAVPFYCNTHTLIDHIHYCAFYICELLTNNIKIDEKEILDYDWFSKKDLNKEYIPMDVKNIGYLAFKKYEEIKNAMD